MTKTQTKASPEFSRFWLYLALTIGLTLSTSYQCLAQEESPLPGNATSNTNGVGANTSNVMAPIPGNGQSAQAPVNMLTSIQSPSKPQSDINAAETFNGPVSLSALQTSVKDMKNSDVSEDSLNKFLAGLDILIKAHNKLAASFSRQDGTIVASNNERNLSKQLCLLKDQILYLKAQILVKENRSCEAASIFADITSFEPMSALGQQCYTRLIEMDFSIKPENQRADSTLAHTPARPEQSKIKRQMGILAR